MPSCMKCDRPKKGNQLMISCRNCKFFCQFSCTSISTYKEFHRIEESEQWMCDNCKSNIPSPCEICFRVDRRKIVLKCSTCCKFSHRSCHNNLYPSHKINIDKWVCNTCSEVTTGLRIPPTSAEVTTLERGIRIGHLNGRDLLSKSKLTDVKIIINRDNYDILAITESWLWPEVTDSEIDIDGYITIRCDRPSIKSHRTRGGGTLIYVKKEYSVQQLAHNFKYPNQVQVVKVQVSKQFMKPIVIFSVYRTSDTPNPFIEQLENEITDSSDHELFVLGDLNIDQINNNQNSLKSLIRRTGVKQMIKENNSVCSEN
jgi:hypothetical protein